jgi:methyl-accepting chemotaxis protein
MRRRLSSRPELRTKIAESSPRSLMRRAYFWFAQTDFWLVVVGSLVAFVILAPYTYIFAHGWIFLTITVQLLAVYGAIITAKSMAALEVELAIVTEVEARAGEMLSRVKANPNSRVDLDQVEQDALPNNPSVPPPSMIRMFQQICKEARDRKFESTTNIVQPYREEALEDIFRLQNIQKIALWLGILGTFIGLLRAIQVGELGNLEQDNFLKMVASMFENLFISFSASLAGLEVAVILGAFLLLLRKRHEPYFQTMESSVVTLVSLARNSANKDDYFVEFGQIRQSRNTVRDRLYHQTQELSQGMNTLNERLNYQTNEIQSGMVHLSQTGVEFDNFLNQVTQRHQQLIDDVKSVYDSLSLRNLTVSLQANVGETAKTISDALNPNVTRLASEISKFNSTLDRLTTALDRQAQLSTDHVTNLKSEITALSREHNETRSAVDGALREIGRKVAANDSRQLADEIRELSSRVGNINLSQGSDRIKPRKRFFRTMWSSLKWSNK